MASPIKKEMSRMDSFMIEASSETSSLKKGGYEGKKGYRKKYLSSSILNGKQIKKADGIHSHASNLVKSPEYDTFIEDYEGRINHVDDQLAVLERRHKRGEDISEDLDEMDCIFMTGLKSDSYVVIRDMNREVKKLHEIVMGGINRVEFKLEDRAGKKKNHKYLEGFKSRFKMSTEQLVEDYENLNIVANRAMNQIGILQDFKAASEKTIGDYQQQIEGLRRNVKGITDVAVAAVVKKPEIEKKPPPSPAHSVVMEKPKVVDAEEKSSEMLQAAALPGVVRKPIPLPPPLPIKGAKPPVLPVARAANAVHHPLLAAIEGGLKLNKVNKPSKKPAAAHSVVMEKPKVVDAEEKSSEMLQAAALPGVVRKPIPLPPPLPIKGAKPPVLPVARAANAARTSLLAAIEGGLKLNKVNKPSKKPAAAQAAHMGGFHAEMIDKLKKRNESVHDTEESDDNSDWSESDD
jgi:hypothetical protein